MAKVFRPRYILIASWLLLLLGVYLVGRNAETAQQLGQQILVQDAGKQPTTDSAAQLKNFVHSHMGTSTAVFLSASYGVAVQAAAAGTSSDQIYHQAQAACVSRTTAVVQAKCVQAYVNDHASAATPLPTVDKSPYSLNYQSPKWTPDLAGVVLAIGGIGLVVGSAIWLSGRL